MPYIQTHNRMQLFFMDTGAGAPVVLVSSAWLNSRMWEFQIAGLAAEGFRCIAYDRRGHGLSDWSWTGYDYDTLADDLAAVMDRLDLHGVTLVGHSAGCGEIVRYLTRHGSDRVAAIALVAGTTPFPMKTDANPEGIDRAFMEADMARRTADRPGWFMDHADGFFGIGLPGIHVSRAFVDFMIRECLTCSARATSEFFLAGFTTDFRRELEAVTVPALVIHGDHDMQAPVELCGRKTAALIPDSMFLLYENAAHGLFVTHAERLNRDLSSFIRRAASDVDSRGRTATVRSARNIP